MVLQCGLAWRQRLLAHWALVKAERLAAPLGHRASQGHPLVGFPPNSKSYDRLLHPENPGSPRPSPRLALHLYCHPLVRPPAAGELRRPVYKHCKDVAAAVHCGITLRKAS